MVPVSGHPTVGKAYIAGLEQAGTGAFYSEFTLFLVSDGDQVWADDRYETIKNATKVTKLVRMKLRRDLDAALSSTERLMGAATQ